MEERYPTEEDLKFIREFDIIENPIIDLIEYLRAIWWMPDWGFKISEIAGVKLLELHTGGWSGNEDIMQALNENTMFWDTCYNSSETGGHFLFEIEDNNQLPDYLTNL